MSASSASQMPLKPHVRDRNVGFVPVFVASLITSNQKNGNSRRIERKQDTPRITRDLNSQFFKVRVLRAFEGVSVGTA